MNVAFCALSQVYVTVFSDVFRTLDLLLGIQFWRTSQSIWLMKAAMRRKHCSVLWAINYTFYSVVHWIVDFFLDFTILF